MRASTICRIFVCSVLLVFLPLLAWAQGERILDYHSDIIVAQDGRMQVRETIRVYATGNQIRHGIYRDFPTRYRDRLGNRYNVAFDVSGVLRDGNSEPYRISSLSNGVRVYIGNSKTYVDPGEHTYVLQYATNRQLGYFQDHDELYWNVTGNGWIFPIDSASATVKLPSSVPPSYIRVEGYTGPQGSTARMLTSTVQPDGTAEFQTTEPLGAQEGLTIVVSFPKGVVIAPNAIQSAKYFLTDNTQALVAIVGCVIVGIYYVLVWFSAGRDPEPGSIMALYQAPPGLSPAGTRFLMRMGFDQKAFAAAVLDMAVRGYLTITDDDGTYILQRTKVGDSVLSPDEKVIASKLFAVRDHLRLETKYRQDLNEALKGLAKSLSATEEKIYFLTNRSYFLPGVWISVLVMAAIILLAPNEKKFIGGFMCVWLSGWSVGVYSLLSQIVRLWRAPAQKGMPSVAAKAGAGALSLFALPFVAGEIFGLGMFGYAVSVPGAIAIAILVALNATFHHLLKAPTSLGRRLMDQVEGFKMFLGAVEGDRMNVISPPDRTPATFEKFLPFALALDVEQQWANQFSSTLAEAGRRQGGQYSPAWYTGSSLAGFAAADFASGFSGSFSSAIASSTSSPGSSSGSGGGGSSGGGGGGGGGGGW